MLLLSFISPASNMFTFSGELEAFSSFSEIQFMLSDIKASVWEEFVGEFEGFSMQLTAIGLFDT